MKPIRGTQINRTHLHARSLVCGWVMNEGSGLYLHDLSGSANHGTLTNMTAADWVAGENGVELDFDGSNDHIRAASVSGFSITASWTMLSRIYFDSRSANTPFTGFSGSSDEGIGLGVTSDDELKVFSPGETPGEGSILSDHTYYDVGLVWDGTKFYAYLDGIEDYNVQPTGSDWQNWTWLDIGYRDIGGTDQYFDGQVVYCYLYQERLSDAVIKDIAERPYQMFEHEDFPAWLYVEAAAGGLSIPVAMHHYLRH